MEIAVAGAESDSAAWDRITAIEELPEEQVYDIEVEGTHNFVGNDIVAHNTYLDGNVGIGTASPGAKLDVRGALKFGDDAGYIIGTPTFGLRINNNADTLNLIIAKNDGTVLIPSGNVGIGTTVFPDNYRIYGVHNTTSWAYRYDNAANGSNIHVAHGGGYGLHVNAGTNASAGTYLLELYSANGIGPSTKFNVSGDGVTHTFGGLVIEVRTSGIGCDPGSPETGRIWLRGSGC
jgi:hypothetical protein